MHPRRFSIEVRYDGPSAGLEHPADFTNGLPSVPGVVQHAVGPYGIERTVVEGQFENAFNVNALGLDPCDLEMPARQVDRLRCQVRGSHLYAALQEFEAVVDAPGCRPA